MRNPIKLFLSYAHGEDDDFVQRLYHDLKDVGFDVWWDNQSLRGRGLPFPQEIKDAIATPYTPVGKWCAEQDWLRPLGLP